MNKQDGFKDLIENYSLDNADSPQPQIRRQAVSRQAPATGGQRQTSNGATAPPSRPRQETARRPAQANPNGKDSFQVEIDEGQFSDGKAPRRPTSRYAGGRQSGGSGGGNGYNGGRRGNDDDEDYDDEPTGSGAGRWLKAILVLTVCLGASFALAMFALSSASDMLGFAKEPDPIQIQLTEDMSMSEVAKLLHSEGVIKQPLVFQLVVGIKHEATEFKPGTYNLDAKMSYDQITTSFIATNSQSRVEVELLFIEGMSLNEIANKLESAGIVDKDELFAYLEAGDFPWDYKFLEQPIADEETRINRYEGYFFPDTYIMQKGMSPAEVTLRFFSNFNNRIDDEVYTLLEQNNMTLDQAITLASVVQKEAGHVEDMGDVSAVFHNRLANPGQFPRLESDVTSFYVAYNLMPQLGENVADSKDKTYNGFTYQKIYEDYDTYVRNGLPVGPICNPGKQAILAALQPADRADYFFVTDSEGNYYYAQTADQHKANCDIALAGGGDDIHGTAVPDIEEAESTAAQ